jgi:hypothetical protein
MLGRFAYAPPTSENKSLHRGHCTTADEKDDNGQAAPNILRHISTPHMSLLRAVRSQGSTGMAIRADVDEWRACRGGYHGLGSVSSTWEVALPLVNASALPMRVLGEE